MDVRYHAGSPEACTAHNPARGTFGTQMSQGEQKAATKGRGNTSKAHSHQGTNAKQLGGNQAAKVAVAVMRRIEALADDE